MRYVFLSFLFLAACQFHPLFGEKANDSVCVASIPDAYGYKLRNELKKYFPESSGCAYTLQVTTPAISMSDQSISNKNLITMQRISASTSYTLLDSHKKILLKSSTNTAGSSAVVQNPYSTVVSAEKTQENLIPILAQKIALHITAYLDGLKE